MDRMIGQFRLVSRERALVGPAGPIGLSSRAVEILGLLLERPEELLTKDELLDTVWHGVVVEENTLQVHMSALRRALGPGFITTVHGRGYRYVGPAPQDVAPRAAAAAAARQGNLVQHRVDCMAREVEHAALVALLRRQRLVSVLGAGGVGKTTLALAAAATLAPDLPGVWVIDLAPLSDGRLVESAVIQALGIPFRANIPAIEAIVDHIRDQGPLVLFDNCEHLAQAVADVAAALLAGAPNIRILATTQIPLGLGEEHVFKLAPFGLGDGGDAPATRFLARCLEALGEAPADADLPIVAQLCRRLDGLALALRMAAAQAATLGLRIVDRQIARQIADRASGWRPSLDRHKSMTASLEWSYSLLSDADRRVLRALGVFQGPFTLEGIRAVAEATDESIAELVRRSILMRERGDRTRYRLLETMRHFALDRLAEAGEAAAVRSRHATHLLRTFMAGLDRWETEADDLWLAAHQPEVDDLRSALGWSREVRDWPVHVALAACSYRFWIQTQLPAEGLAACRAAAAHKDDTPPDVSALLSLALGELYRLYRLDVRALESLEPALAYYASGTNVPRRVQTLILHAWSNTILLDHEAARPSFRALDALSADMPPSKLKARALVMSAISRWGEDKILARAKLDAGLEMHVATGNTRGYWLSVMLSAEIMHHAGDTAEAIALVMRVLPDVRAFGNADEHSGQAFNLGMYLTAIGDFERARALVLESTARTPRDDINAWWCQIQLAAEIMAHDGEPEKAALLLGFADAGFASGEDGRQLSEVMQRARIVALLDRSGLSPERRRQLSAQGASLSMFEAQVLAGFSRSAALPAGAS